MGVVNGNWYSSHMLQQSNLLRQRGVVMIEGGYVYSPFDDPVYPQSLHILGGFPHVAISSPGAEWNIYTPKACELVE